MSQFARINTLDVLRDVKAALASFAEDAGLAVSEAQSDVQRTIWRISHDLAAHWQREIKKRAEKLNQAKAELFRKQLESNDTRASAAVERKQVARCQAALEEAEEKLRRVKKWSIALEREFMLFKAQLQQISSAISGDIPQALSRVEKMMDSLHAYISLQAPTQSTPTMADATAATSSEVCEVPPSGGDGASGTFETSEGTKPTPSGGGADQRAAGHLTEPSPPAPLPGGEGCSQEPET